MKKIFNFKKPLLCVLLCVCVLVGAFAVSGNSSNTETYTFDFEEKTSGSYNGSTGWSYDKPSGGIAGNNTSLLKYDPPNKTTYNIAFIMPEAQNGKYVLDFDSEYEITFRYYSEGIRNGKVDAFMIREGASKIADTKLEIDKTGGTGGVWKTATVNFSPEKDGENLGFGLKTTAGQSDICIYFDDFVVTKKTVQQGPPDEIFLNTAQGIINFDSTNGSINSSGLKYYTADRKYVKGNSTTMLKHTAVTTTDKFRVAFYNGTETVELTPEKLYTIKFKYYNPTENGNTVITIGTADSGSAWTHAAIGDSLTLLNSTDAWVDGELQFTVAPAAPDAKYLFIQFQSGKVGAEVYVDNFQIIEEPDMDIDIVDINFEDRNATLNSKGWSWVDASGEPIGGNSTTVMRFDPEDDKKLEYYVEELYKGKRTVPINDGASYALSFDYYADPYEGTLGEFYIKNKSRGNIFYSDLDITAEKGTDGVWKRANFVFTATAAENDYLQIMCYAKEENTTAVVYFDNFRLVRIDNLIAAENMLTSESDAFNVSVSKNSGDFTGYADISLQFRFNFKSTYGNKKVIEIAGEKYLVSDYGMIYRPQQFSGMGALVYKEADLSDELISVGYHTTVTSSAADYMQFASKIINIRKLYKDMDIEAKPYIVISPMDGKGTVYTYGATVTVNAADLGALSQDEAVKNFVS